MELLAMRFETTNLHLARIIFVLRFISWLSTYSLTDSKASWVKISFGFDYSYRKKGLPSSLYFYRFRFLHLLLFEPLEL